MGSITNKFVTKHRTKDHLGPVAISGDWDSSGSLVASSIVRAAASALGGSSVSSTAFRGQDFLSINASRSTRASTVWVEQSGYRKWTLTLGVTKFSYGRAVDWQMMFEIVDGLNGRVANVSTPDLSTHDGKLMNKDEFMETRDLILSGFSLGQSPNLNIEEELTRVSNGRMAWPLHGWIDGAEKGDQRIRTKLSSSEIDGVLDCLPCQVIERTDFERVLKLGASGESPIQTLKISYADQGEFRQLHLHFEIGMDAPTAVNVSNVQHAFFLCTRFLELLRALDGDVSIVSQ